MPRPVTISYDKYKKFLEENKDFQETYSMPSPAEHSYTRVLDAVANTVSKPYTVNFQGFSPYTKMTIDKMVKSKLPNWSEYGKMLQQATDLFTAQRPADISTARRAGVDISAFGKENNLKKTWMAQEAWDKAARASGDYDSEKYMTDEGVGWLSDDYLQNMIGQYSAEERRTPWDNEKQFMRDTFGIEDDAEAARLWETAIYDPSVFIAEMNADGRYAPTDMFNWTMNLQKQYGDNAELAKARLDLLNRESKRRENTNAFYANEDVAKVRGLENYNQLRAYTPGTEQGGMWTLYEWLNNPGYREQQRQWHMQSQALSNGAMDYQDMWEKQGYNYWTDDEIADFNAILWSEGEEAAERYASSLMSTGMPQRRRAYEQVESYRELAASESFLGKAAMFALSTASNAASTIQAPGQYIASLFGGDDPNSYAFDMNRMTQAIRQQQGQDAYDWGQSWGGDLGGRAMQFLYTGAASMADMMVARGMGGASRAADAPKLSAAITQGIMSSQAASNTLYNELQNGGSTEGAVMKGLLAAGIEAFTEKYSIDAFMKNPTTGLKYALQNILTEGAEEDTATLLNAGVDELISGMTADTGAFTESYYNGLRSGLKPEAAFAQALGQFMEELGTDTLLGAFSGGVLATPGAIGIHTMNAQTGQRIQENDYAERLLDIAQNMPEDSKSRQLAETLRPNKAPAMAKAEALSEENAQAEAAPAKEETPKKGKKLSSAKMGQLYRTLYSDLDDQGKATLASTMEGTVKARLEELGESSGSAQKVAGPLSKLLGDGKLTEDEKQTIAQSKHGMRVYNEIRFAEDETYSSGWVATAKETAQKAVSAVKETKAELASMLEDKVSRAAVTQAEQTVGEKGVLAPTATDTAEGRMNIVMDDEEGKPAQAEVMKIAENTKGGLQVEIKDAGGNVKTVAWDDVRYNNKGTASIMAYIANSNEIFTTEEANKMVQTYMGGDVQQHLSGFASLYNAGYMGRSMPPSQMAQAQVIYDLGRQDAAAADETRLKSIGKGMKGKGSVTFAPGLNERTLSKKQRSSVYALRVLGKAAGIDFVMYESKADAQGSYKAANGRYNAKNNTIYIDLNSGKSGENDAAEYAILRTASHELTHYIEHNSSSGYAALKDFAKAEFTRKGKSYDQLVEEKMRTRGLAGERLTRAGAEAEVMADAMEMMLQDSKAIERLAQRDKNLFEKIKRFIVEYFKRVHDAFAKVNPEHAEAIALMDMDADGVMRYSEKMVQLWGEALVEAVETVQGKEETTEQMPEPVEQFSLSNPVEQRLEKLNAVDGVQFSKRISGYEKPTPKLSKRQYETFGWVRANNVLGKQAYKTLMEKYSKVYEGIEYAPESHDGYKIIESGDEFGVNKYIVLVKGSLSYPEINRIFSINYDEDTRIDYIRRMLADAIEESYTMENDAVGKFDALGLLTVANRLDYQTYRGYAKKYTNRNAGRNGKEPIWTYAKWAERNGYDNDLEEDVQESRREVTGQVNMWDYMAELEAEEARTGEEAAALTNYKRVMGDLRKAITERNKYRTELNQAQTPQERGMALNRLGIATRQMDRAYDLLYKVMDTPAMKAIEQRSTAFVQEYLDEKTLQDVAELINAEEAEIKRLAGKNEKEAQKHREIVRQLRSKATENLLKEREKFHNMMDRDRRVRDMNMKAAQHRKHLAAQVKKLDGLIRHETDYKHVPEELKPLVETFVGAFTEKGAGIVFNKQQADKLSRVYRKLLQTDGSMNQLGYLYDEDVMAQMDELNDLLEDELAVRSGKGMTMEDRARNRLATMEDLAELSDSIYGMVKNANNLFYGGKKAQFAAIGTEAVQAMEQRKDYKRLKGKAGENIEAVDSFMRAGNMTPVYFFDRLKNKVLKNLYGDMLEAQEEYAFRVAETRRFWQEVKSRYNYDSWADDAALTMTTEKGKQLTLDKEDAMSVYATWKREHADELLTSYHLEEGGIVLEGNQMQDSDKKYLVAVRTTPSTLTGKDMAKIYDYLTEEQKAYADAVVEYMSTTMADYGNETSMELYGIKKYKESYYFPMKSASDQLYQKSTTGGGQVTDDNRVKHRSFTMARVRSAATPVVIGKFSQVAAMHMEQMILYSTMTMPIESMNRVLNYKHQFEDGSKTTVRALMEQKYGPVMKKYMETFLSDMNGGLRRDGREAGLNRLVSLFKRGSVLASASVVVQQPTAIARATAMISPRHLIATTVPHRGDYNELKRHSGVAILKNMGKFDVDMGAATAEWMLDADEGSYSMWQKVRQAANIRDFETFKKRWNAIFTWAPGKADEMTWAWLWRAVKAEQAEVHPELNTGSDAFLDVCGERFNDIVNHTQVYDSTLVRSQNMRSKSGMMQMITSFMSEPTLTANMLYDAVSNKERGKKYAVRAVTAALVSQILTSLAQALVSAGRDEDEKKTWAEKYAGKAAGNLASNLNPMNMLPLLRDIQSLMDGYDVTRADMSIFTEISKAFGKLDSDNLSPYRKAEELGGSLAKLFGIPAKNIMRDMRSFVTTFLGNADRPTMGYAVGEAVKAELIPFGQYDTSATAYYTRAYNAMMRGDMEESETIREYMVSVLGKKDEDVDKGIRDALKVEVLNGVVSEEKATKWLLDNGLKEKEADAYRLVDGWVEKEAHKDDEEYSYSMYNSFLDSIETGGKAMVDEAKKLLELGVDKKTIATEIAKRYKNQLIDLYKKGKASTLMARLLRAYQAIGYDRDYELNYIKKNWLGIK